MDISTHFSQSAPVFHGELVPEAGFIVGYAALIDRLNHIYQYRKVFDATRQAEFLYDCVKDTLDNIIPEEIVYLTRYDEFKRYLDDEFEMPDKTVDLLVRFLEQNNGHLSQRAREKEFVKLSITEIQTIEERFKEIFQLLG